MFGKIIAEKAHKFKSINTNKNFFITTLSIFIFLFPQKSFSFNSPTSYLIKVYLLNLQKKLAGWQ